jgi:hypothetical protein
MGGDAATEGAGGAAAGAAWSGDGSMLPPPGGIHQTELAAYLPVVRRWEGAEVERGGGCLHHLHM